MGTIESCSATDNKKICNICNSNSKSRDLTRVGVNAPHVISHSCCNTHNGKFVRRHTIGFFL